MNKLFENQRIMRKITMNKIYLNTSTKITGMKEVWKSRMVQSGKVG